MENKQINREIESVDEEKHWGKEGMPINHSESDEHSESDFREWENGSLKEYIEKKKKENHSSMYRPYYYY